MPLRMRRTRVRRTTRTGMPHISRSTSSAIRLAKSGIDIVPKLITSVLDINNVHAGVNSYTFNATNDAKVAFNPI